MTADDVPLCEGDYQHILEEIMAMTAAEMLLVINDIHNLTLGSRLGGNLKAIMLEIERLAEDAIERACNEGAGDTDFIVDG